MYSKQEASLLRQEFWTVFGKYMLPIASAEGEKINWVNYKTGKKYIRFVMDADNRKAGIAVVLLHPGIAERKEVFDQMLVLKDALEGGWNWDASCTGEQGHTMGCIYASLENISILNKADWPELISFFKPRLMALDRFWCDHKFVFE